MSTLVYSSGDDTSRPSRIGMLESSAYDTDSEFDEYENTDSCIDDTECSFELKSCSCSICDMIWDDILFRTSS